MDVSKLTIEQKATFFDKFYKTICKFSSSETELSIEKLIKFMDKLGTIGIEIISQIELNKLNEVNENE